VAFFFFFWLRIFVGALLKGVGFSVKGTGFSPYITTSTDRGL
jgi:hypothetical protein